jgi:hypothetical protein
MAFPKLRSVLWFGTPLERWFPNSRELRRYFERDWDQETQTSTRYIEPGDTYNMDWFFRIKPEHRNQEMICDGELRVIDADSDTILTDLPVQIVNSAAN